MRSTENPATTLQQERGILSTGALIGIGAAILLLGVVFFLLTRSSASKSAAADQPRSQPAVTQSESPKTSDQPEETGSKDLLAAAKHQYYCTAFGVTGFDAVDRDDDARVIAAVERSLATSIEQERHLPRRPMLIPQLLRALNDEDSTRSELATIILQDPVLAADVLKLANSPYYRISREPVDNIDRAIVLLGTEGLKSVVAASIMQPVFRTAKGQFEAFAPTLWDLAMRTSTAAGIYATRTRIADPFTAQLLGLLSTLGPLAVFRVTSEVYKQQAKVPPRAGVYVRLIENEANAASVAIATHWELPATFVLALSDSQGTGHLEGLSPLGRVLEAGRCCALLSLAPATNQRSILANKAAMAMGLETTAFDAVWSALTTPKSSSK